MRGNAYSHLTLTQQHWQALAGKVLGTRAKCLQSKLGQARDRCCVPRFQSAVPVIQQAVQALARLTTAVAATGAREHAGNLVLAWVTSNVQQACPCACVSAPMQHTGLAAQTLLPSSVLLCVGEM